MADRKSRDARRALEMVDDKIAEIDERMDEWPRPRPKQKRKRRRPDPKSISSQPDPDAT